MKEEEKNHETTGKKTTLTDKIYQDIKDFIFVFQLGLNETMNDSLVVCKEHFREFWGQRLVNTMRALHDVKYTPADDDEEEEMEDENSLL